MEASEPTPAGGVSAQDLAELVKTPGPFLTLYLSTDPHIDNAAHRSEQRWRTLRGDLRDAGAPEETLDAIDPVVPDAHQEGGCLAVVANAGGVLHVEHGEEVPSTDVARWAPLPSLTRIIEWRQSSPAHLAVLADRTGADLVAIRRGAADIHREAGGHDDPIRKVAPGGWSQRRFQQRAENTWEENAEETAVEIRRMVELLDARLIVAAGDVRAIQMLQEEIPKELQSIFHVVEGGRATDGSNDAYFEEVARVVAEKVAGESEALMQRFREEVGQEDRAAEGIEATVRALTMAQVEVLLVHEEDDDERTAWFGPDPTQLAAKPEDLRALGVDDPSEGRLVDVLVRSALGTGAGTRVLPPIGGPAEGVGAILRWSNS